MIRDGPPTGGRIRDGPVRGRPGCTRPARTAKTLLVAGTGAIIIPCLSANAREPSAG
jgi:hypothetical protein